jgi:hypothetical protein
LQHKDYARRVAVDREWLWVALIAAPTFKQRQIVWREKCLRIRALGGQLGGALHIPKNKARRGRDGVFPAVKEDAKLLLRLAVRDALERFQHALKLSGSLRVGPMKEGKAGKHTNGNCLMMASCGRAAHCSRDKLGR